MIKAEMSNMIVNGFYVLCVDMKCGCLNNLHMLTLHTKNIKIILQHDRVKR